MDWPVADIQVLHNRGCYYSITGCGYNISAIPHPQLKATGVAIILEVGVATTLGSIFTSHLSLIVISGWL